MYRCIICNDNEQQIKINNLIFATFQLLISLIQCILFNMTKGTFYFRVLYMVVSMTVYQPLFVSTGSVLTEIMIYKKVIQIFNKYSKKYNQSNPVQDKVNVFYSVLCIFCRIYIYIYKNQNNYRFLISVESFFFFTKFSVVLYWS